METDDHTFTLQRCLGRGGFGEVYLADMVGRGGLVTPVAVKLLRGDLDPTGQAVQRLRDEGRLLARLDHPTILRVVDLVELNGRAALVTEYVQGEDLDASLRSEPRIPPRALVQVIGRVAGALSAAWSAPLAEGGSPLHLAHRDVKPSNIRVGRYGDVKLLDFGIARSDEVTREARTTTDMLIGSPPYMAPERFLDAVVRSASDVYALGATLLEGLLGRRVFDLPVTMLAAHAVDRDRYERYVAQQLADLPADTDPALVDLARRLLAHDPAARPDARELERQCEDLADRLPGPTLTTWCRQRPWTEPESGPPTGLEGQRGTLPSLERPLGEPPPLLESTFPPGARRVGWWLGGLSVLSVTGLGGLVVVGLTAAGLWWATLPAPVAETPPPAPAPVVAPEPAPVIAPPPEPRDPSPSPVPAPIAGPGVARPAPGPTPAPPPAPAPTPAPSPVAAAPPTGRVLVGDGADGAFLVLGGRRVALPGEVPPGTWEIHAALGAPEAVRRGELTVVAGQVHTVECKPRMFFCAAVR